jgi:hypothetical protein
MTDRVAVVRPWMGIALASALLFGLLGCGDNSSGIKADPNNPIKYSIFGFVTEDIISIFANSNKLSDVNKQGVVIGSEQDGTTFDLTGYGSFVIYVPPESGTLFIDAVSVGGTYFQSGNWNWSGANFIPTGTTWAAGGDANVEGPPDGLTIESVPGEACYVGFSLKGQTTVTFYPVTP